MNACRAATRPTSKCKQQHPEREREPAQCGDAEDHGQRAGHEQDDQVPREDVREKSNRQREDAHEVGEHLEEEDQRRPCRLRPLREQAL